MAGIRFIGRIYEVKSRNCKDLSRTCRVVIETEEMVAGKLEEIPADKNVCIIIEEE